MAKIITDEKFKRLYDELETDLIDFLKEQELDPDDFESYISQMSSKVCTRILLLNETAITGNQAYRLMKLPYDAMIKLTKPKSSK